MRHPFHALTIGLLLCASCSSVETPEPGIIYEIEFKDQSGSGAAIFESVGDLLTGTYYADEGELYATMDVVTVRHKGRRFLMKFDNEEEKEFTFRPYTAPAYQEFDEVMPYLDSVYSVTREEVTYVNHVEGYWTSYPKEPGKSFGDIYMERLGTVLDGWNGKDDLSLTMDVYTPEGDAVSSRPLFLLIHGGAFYYEDKADPDYEAFCNYFASRGYVAAAINYRMGFLPTKEATNKAGYRAVQDAHAAVRYLVGDKRFKIDPDRVFVAGNSAGAITALNLAYFSEDTRGIRKRKGSIRERIDEFGKKASETINQLWGTELGKDLGPINALNPGDTTRFSIRAVGNMWGAVLNLAIFDGDKKIPIVSFHSKLDPTVDYEYDYPFRNYFEEELFQRIEKFPDALDVLKWSRITEKANRIVFDKMYGSHSIDQKARSMNIKSKLYTYDEPKHSLHLDDGVINHRLYEIAGRMAEFFSSEMETPSVSLQWGKAWVWINSTNVRRHFWRLEGGVIRENKVDSIRVLLFPDAEIRSVSVTGEYNSQNPVTHTRNTFKEELDL